MLQRPAAHWPPYQDEGAIENIGKLEVSNWEKNIGILGIVAGIAPMFGSWAHRGCNQDPLRYIKTDNIGVDVGRGCNVDGDISCRFVVGIAWPMYATTF